MKKTWYCVWCGRHRSKAPVKEQKSLQGGWLPLCSYCQRKKEKLTSGDALASSLIKLRTITTDQGKDD